MSGCGGGCGSCVCSSGSQQRRAEAVAPLREPFASTGGVPAADLAREVEAMLAEAGVPSPRADATHLLRHLLGKPVALAGAVTPGARDAVLAAAGRRAAREPLQHIVGRAWFRHLELRVGPGVFVPRPETELVVEAALRLLPQSGPAVVVDLGAGSGAIGLSLAIERPGTTVYAVELDPAALPWLTTNVMQHAEQLRRAHSRILVVLGDAGAVSRPDQPLGKLAGSVHVVVANPPYIPTGAVPRDPEVRDYDPELALYGGADGLEQVRRWLATAADLLPRGGYLVMEHGDQQGGDDGVPGLLSRHEDLAAAGPVWAEIADHPDLAGRARYATARRM